MCGRVAQTVGVVNIAARNFSTSPLHEALTMPSDNFNLSPGMDCDVMLVNENGDFQVDRKKWGLITKNGTLNKPLCTDGKEVIKLCFESLCYNARSETLYSKPIFSNLAHKRRTCIIAIDGYFEWKSHEIPKMKKRKQPYFVYRKQQIYHDAEQQQQRKTEPLLIAGIWTSVATGISETPELGSFAMLTMDASEQIKWLHHRMPLCIWDIGLAKQWLTQPSETLKKKLENAARCKTNGCGWHKVTPEMSKLTFRSKEAIKEMKETIQSISNFFAARGPLVKKSEKEDPKHLSSYNYAMSENNNKVKTTSHSKSCVAAATAADTQEKSAPITRDGKRQSNLPSYFSPNRKQNFKKSKLNRSPAPNSNQQISISHFFDKKKK